MTSALIWCDRRFKTLVCIFLYWSGSDLWYNLDQNRTRFGTLRNSVQFRLKLSSACMGLLHAEYSMLRRLNADWPSIISQLLNMNQSAFNVEEGLLILNADWFTLSNRYSARSPKRILLRYWILIRRSAAVAESRRLFFVSELHFITKGSSIVFYTLSTSVFYTLSTSVFLTVKKTEVLRV